MQLAFQTAFTAIKDVFLTLWTEGVEPVLSQVMSIWTDFTAILKSLWDEYGESTFTKVRDAIDNTKEVFYNAWETYLKPTWDTIMETVDWLWTKHLKPLTERIGEFVMKFIQAALDIYNQFIVPVVKWLQEILGPVFQRIWGLISSVVGTVVGFISDLISALLRQIGGIVDFVAGVFTGDWERAWNGVKDIFGGIVDGVKSVFKGAINLIIDIINDFTGGLNWIPKTLSKVPGFGWAKDWQIPQIPKFAKGGIVDRPTLALIGEAGDEAVIAAARCVADFCRACVDGGESVSCFRTGGNEFALIRPEPRANSGQLHRQFSAIVARYNRTCAPRARITMTYGFSRLCDEDGKFAQHQRMEGGGGRLFEEK